nr:PREDICTED: uncharacterized protein LOC104138437 [Struthio camelus australis]
MSMQALQLGSVGPALQSSPGTSSSGGSTEDIPSAVRAKDLAGNVQQKILLDYSTYMARVVPAEAGGSPARSPSQGTPDSPAAPQLFTRDSHPRWVLLRGGRRVPKSALREGGRTGPRAAPVLALLLSCRFPRFSHVSGNSTSRKILRFVDKIAKSKYFQKATENEFIKKKIEEVSNTPLLLTVEVQELAGTLAVNVPPPPTDRVWYSFRVPPQLELKVHPKLGEREVTFLHVTEWIEKKLQHEFQKILVMPNMDDLIIPIMHSGLDPQPPAVGLPRDLPAKEEKRL